MQLSGENAVLRQCKMIAATCVGRGEDDEI